MFPKSDPHSVDASQGVAAIDFQWAGVGLGAADVMYMMHGCVHPAVIRDPRQELDILWHYWHTFVEAARVYGPQSNPAASHHVEAQTDDQGRPLPPVVYLGPGQTPYTFQEFVRDYKLAFLDYVRVVFGYVWAKATPDSHAANAAILARCVHTRDPMQAVWLIDKADRWLAEYESGDLA